jgi:hypothetical protein
MAVVFCSKIYFTEAYLQIKLYDIQVLLQNNKKEVKIRVQKTQN